MSEEIEEGELSSEDGELNDKTALTKLNKSELDTKLNNDEKDELNKLLNKEKRSSSESGELSENDVNPFDKEDESMIKIRMEALQSKLQSLLDKSDQSVNKDEEVAESISNSNGNGDEITKKPNKKLKKKKKASLSQQRQPVQNAPSQNQYETTDEVLVIDETEFAKGINQKRKLFDLIGKNVNKNAHIKKQKKFNNNGMKKSSSSSSSINSPRYNSTNVSNKNAEYYYELERKNLKKIASASSTDNYNVEDMVIDSPHPITTASDFAYTSSQNVQSNFNMMAPYISQLASFLIQSNNNTQLSSSTSQSNDYLYQPQLNEFNRNIYNQVHAQMPTTSNMQYDQFKPSSFPFNNNSFMKQLMNIFQQATMQQQQPQHNDLFANSLHTFGNSAAATVSPAPKPLLSNSSYLSNSQTQTNPSLMSNPHQQKQQRLNKVNSKSFYANNKITEKSSSLLVNENSYEKENTKSNVVFTLSSPSGSSSTSTCSNSSKKRANSSTGNVLDLDERFIDPTSSKLDVDYRQNIINQKLFQSRLSVYIDKIDKLNDTLSKQGNAAAVASPVIADINQSQQVDEKSSEENKEEEEEEDDSAMMELRMKLLDQKSLAKKQKEEKERLERMKEEETKRSEAIKQKEHEENQMNQDMILLKKKLLEQEKELIVSRSSENLKRPSISNGLTGNSSNHINGYRPKSISPIIIHINPNDKDDSDDDFDSDSKRTLPHSSSILNNESLKSNIDLFLNQAKQMAASNLSTSRNENGKSVQKQKAASTPALTKNNNNNNQSTYELDKKKLIKTLRDRINSTSKEIVEFSKKSVEIKQIKVKKDQDTELIKAKIAMLREQLQAAEKVLVVNEEACLKFLLQNKFIDAKLVKLQNLKKTQQQLLQKILSSGPAPPANANNHGSLLNSVSKNQSIEAKPNTSITNTPFQPPLPTSSPPPLPSGPSNQQLPPQPPPPPPLPSSASLPPVETSSQPVTADSSLKQSEVIHSKLASQMTLGSVVAATASKNSFKLNNSSVNMTNESFQSISRPNLFTSESTILKLEKLAKETSQQVSINSGDHEMNESMVIDAKVVNITSNKKLVNKKNENHSTTTKSLTPTVAATATLTTTVSKLDNESKKAELETRLKLIECLNHFNIDYPHVHHESFDIWCNESIVQSSTPFSLSDLKNNKLCLNEPEKKEENEMDEGNRVENSSFTSHFNSKIFVINSVNNYESPLRMFRGYRFCSHYSQLNQFDDAYSKYYCNAIDFRKQFCPFDLHGSCKDSNCIYQHSNTMTMDNIQRTEHFISYAPKLLGLTQAPTQKEAIKKLKLYAKTFMTTNLNKMSIKDYFKYLYDHVKNNLDVSNSSQSSTILSRMPILCLNNNKSLGVCDHLNASDYENENSDLMNDSVFNHDSDQFTSTSTQSISSSSIENALVHLFDRILNANMNRSLEIKLSYLLLNGVIDLNWLKDQYETKQIEVNKTSSFFLSSDELIIGWIYFAKHVYVNALGNSLLTASDQIEKLLNVLSHSLESNSKCELLWLVYLKSYLYKRNSIDDYHEVCLLCLDNLITFDLIWFMLNTCGLSYVDLLFERAEKYLLNVDSTTLVLEFEQRKGKSDECDEANRKSFYLFELILFNVYLKLNFSSSTSTEESAGKVLLKKYLSQSELTGKLDPNDLCLLWLCLIHLETFNYLPNWLRINTLLTSRVNQDIFTNDFWRFLDCEQNENETKTRTFNDTYFNTIKSIYELRSLTSADNSKRTLDLFLIPWNLKQSVQSQQNLSKLSTSKKHQTHFNYSIEKIQNLFYEGLKAISTRCAGLANCKHYTRLVSLPLFINLMYLEVSNKRYETAVKICERLLKSNDTEMFKELWLTFIYIKLSQLNHSKLNNLVVNDDLNIESIINNFLEKFANDPRVVYVSAKYYSSADQKQKAIELIESLIQSFYVDESSKKFEPTVLFEHFLGLFSEKIKKETFSRDINENKLIRDQLDSILNDNLKINRNTVEFSITLLDISVCYCYYMQLREMESEQICSTYEKLIQSFKTINHRSVLWSRYLKYASVSNAVSENSQEPSSQKLKQTELIFKLIKKFVNDLNEVAIPNNNIIVPFNYFWKNERKENKNSNNNNNKNIDQLDFFYHNCLIDLLIKLFARTLSDKFLLTNHLVGLMPKNVDLVKLNVNYSMKLNGINKTLQIFYDHLSINSIDIEHLWILCIDVCLELNDLQQAILIYQKADLICTKANKSTIELKRLSEFLFPSTKPTNVL